MPEQPPKNAASAEWLDGYEFALRNLSDEAVQADLVKIVESGSTTSDVRLVAQEPGLPAGSGPAPAHESGATAAIREAEIWIDTLTVRVGYTTVRIERAPTSGLGGDRDADRWRVVAPKWADKIGDDRWFESHVAAERFAGHMAELLNKQRSAWDDAMRTIRCEWLWHLAPKPEGATDGD